MSAGISLYDQVVTKVPPCAPKDLAFVDRHVRETSLRSMGSCTAAEDCDGGLDGFEGGVESAPAVVAVETKSIVQHVNKRRLYRQSTGEEVPWFPHDNSAEFMKELL